MRVGSITAAEIKELNPPRTKPEWLGEALAAAALVAMLIVIAVNYGSLPARIPSHFDLAGTVNGYAGKGLLWVFCGIALFVHVPLTLFASFPQIANYPVALTHENAARQIRLMRGLLIYLKAAVCWLMFYLCYQIIAVALGRNSGGALGWGLLVVILALILLPLPVFFVAAHKLR